MAFDQSHIGAENLGAGTRAATDLRTLQFHAVQVFPTGVLAATVMTRKTLTKTAANTKRMVVMAALLIPPRKMRTAMFNNLA